MAKRLEGTSFQTSTSHPFEWRRREWNKQADYAANTAMNKQETREAIWIRNGCIYEDKWSMLLFTDGGKRKETAAFGWTVLGIGEEGYFELGWGFGLLPPETHSLLAEAAAIEREI